jgi:flagellar M-ring protein FliF
MNTSFDQIGKQLLGLWKQLGVNQRISLALTALLVAVGLSAIVFWSSRTDYALLYGRLPESESAKVIAALDEAKVPYKISSGGGSILVPGNKVHQVRMQLATKGIPRGDGVGFEIFDKSNIGVSDFIQRANYLRAVQGELARTIGQVDSIESARVMVVIPENRLLVNQEKKPTASVFVRVRGNAQLPGQTVNAIRFLVANAVEGLQPNHVSVVDNLGNVLSENSEGDSLAGLSSTQLAARKNLEQYLSHKAEDMLSTVLGPGQAVVRVAAEINFDTTTRTEEKYDPDVQLPRIATVNDEKTETTTTTPSAGGVPGVSTNGNGETNVVAAMPVTGNHTQKKVTSNQYELNKTTSNMMQAAGGIRRLSAAVFVAAKVEGTGSSRKTVSRSPEELEKLKRLVQNALGIQDKDPLRQDQITLEEMPFNETPAQEISRQLDKQQKYDFWWSLAGKAIYPLLAAGVLFAFWRLFQRTPSDAIPVGVRLGEHEAPGINRLAGRNGPPVVTVEVLNELIRENPTNMTQAVRSWMGRGQSN